MSDDVLFQNVPNSLTMAVGSDLQPIESSVVPVCGKPTSNSLTKISGVRNHIPYSDHNYGKPLTPPDSCSPDHPEEADTGNEDEGFTRCICGFKHDDGYMICCDRCSAWQHIECVGIKSNCVPDTYLCDVCDPRPLDKKRAAQIQTKKLEDPTDEEDDEDGDVSDHDSDNTISRVSLPNSASMKENVLTKGGKRKKRESTRKLNKKEMKHNKRKRRKRKHMSTDSIPVDEETNGPWNISSFPEHKHYEEANQTVYIGDLENRIFPLLESSVNANSLLKPEQMCKVVDVQKNKKGVVVTEDINGQQFIIECKGNLMLESKFKEDHPMFSKCDPFVLYYTKLELVMDFSSYGNDARFIRRSCSPTAVVRHVVSNDKPHLVIVSLTPLAKGTEVTLAFEFPLREYRRQLDCACAQENCEVQKHNMAIHRVEQTNGYRSSKDEHGQVDSSLSNHMDSDSEEGDVKDTRSRKKLSREDRKLQQYVRQIEKMEKTEKKKQQSNGRDGRIGILTQRNYPDEYNGETPSKPGKGLRKQGLSQRQQRKIQAIRRGHRLPSCSSEPLSPEDNYSSAASTPTTPCVNVTEESNELLHSHHDTPEKSFKFPKFKKGSLNDVNSSTVDVSRSNNPSPESTTYPSPSKTSFDARLVEVDEPVSDRLNSLHVNINGGVSPRTDCSPSPCHSTYASPTHSESVDLPDMFTRHHLASPTGSSVASIILNSGLYGSNHTHTTLKKRWLKQYSDERPVNKLPNGVISTNSLKPSQISRVVVSTRTFPLPYKRRKLMEYQRTVNNTKTSPQTTLEAGASVEGASEVPATALSTVKYLSSVPPPMTSTTSSVSVTSSNNIPLLNCMMSSTTSYVRPSMLSSMRATISSGLLKSDETVSARITGSEETSWRRRVSGGSDDVSVGRSSLSSMGSTDDAKMDNITDGTNGTKVEQSFGSNLVGSTSEISRKAPVSIATPSVQIVPENSQESGSDKKCDEETPKTTAHVGSSVVVEGSGSGTTTTTPGGKKKVSLSEYLNRKKGKKEVTPVSLSDVTSASQTRVSNADSVLANSADVSSSGFSGSLLSPDVSRSISEVTSSVSKETIITSGVLSSTSGVMCSSSPAVISSTSAVMSNCSTSGVMIEPVSPDEGYRLDDDRPLLQSTVQGSSSDAMDIDDDDAPSSSTILVNAPVISLPGVRSAVVTSSDVASSLAGKSYSNLGQSVKYNVSSAQPLPERQVINSTVPSESLARQAVPVSQVPNIQPRDFRSTSTRPFH